MHPTASDFEMSMRRAPARRRVFLTIASLSVTHRGALCKAAGVEWTQLMGILYGRPPKYRVELALVPLGLVREVVTPNGVALEITERGRRKARQLTARAVRKDAARRQRAAGPLQPAAPVEGDRAPARVDTRTFSITFSTP